MVCICYFSQEGSIRFHNLIHKLAITENIAVFVCLWILLLLLLLLLRSCYTTNIEQEKQEGNLNFTEYIQARWLRHREIVQNNINKIKKDKKKETKKAEVPRKQFQYQQHTQPCAVDVKKIKSIKPRARK